MKSSIIKFFVYAAVFSPTILLGTPPSQLQSYISSQNWNEVQKEVVKGLDTRAITVEDLKTVSQEAPNTPFSRAVQGAINLCSLKDRPRLRFSEFFSIALHAEKYISSETHFWDSKVFGREVQYDPETSSFFIHFSHKDGKLLGVGRKKSVSKTVRYNSNNPELMARGVTTCSVEKEVDAMRALQGLPGLIDAHSLMTHRDPKSHKKTYSIITKIYNSGSLQDVLDNKKIHLSSKERLQIAYDITQGLANMHGKGYVHRDMGARNYFVHISESPKRSVHAVIADMGRTIPITEAKNVPVQGNTSYISPEGYFRKKMMGADYYSSDLFAVGCVLWHLYFGKAPIWRKHSFYKQEKLSLKKRQVALLSHLNKARSQAQKLLPTKKEKYSPKDSFLNIILQMTHPDPKKRGTAEEIHSRIKNL